MKSICVLCDAQGNLRVVLSRNGDLVRRETSSPAGTTHLVWTSLAPAGIGPRRILEDIEASVLPRFAGRVTRGYAPWSFYRDMMMAAFIRPLASPSLDQTATPLPQAVRTRFLPDRGRPLMKWMHLLDRLEGAYAETTIAGYRADFGAFADWARRKRLAALPAQPATLARYVDELGEDFKPGSVKRKLSAIRKIHRLAGFDNIAADEEVVLALRRLKRKKPGRPEQALGVTLARRYAARCVPQ